MNAQKILNQTVVFAVVVLATMLVFGGVPARGSEITGSDIVAIPKGLTGSGNGTLDLRMLTFSGSEITNAAGSFNGDNGNNTLPNSGGADTSSFIESYVTTAGKLKAFYNLNFTPGSIDEIVLFLDLNETGPGATINTLGVLDVILNPTTIQGTPDPVLGDVSSAEQAAINQVYTGGTLAANLNPQPAANLPLISQGAGFADYAIFTGIDPFALNDSDVLLFNVSMDTLSSSSEEIFLSGDLAGHDIPEPATMTLLGLGGVMALIRRRRRQAVNF